MQVSLKVEVPLKLLDANLRCSTLCWKQGKLPWCCVCIKGVRNVLRVFIGLTDSLENPSLFQLILSFPTHFVKLTMRSSFFAALVIVSTTLVSAAPLSERGVWSPPPPPPAKGGNAQSGYAGSTNGGAAVNSGGFISNGVKASKYRLLYFYFNRHS